MSRDGGIPFSPLQMKSLKNGRRTHMCIAAWWSPRAKLDAKGDRAVPKYRHPTEWQRISPGDRLFVKEDMVLVVDSHNRSRMREHYWADLIGGHAPMPGSRTRWRSERVMSWNMERQYSRFVIDVEAVRIFPAQEITWDIVALEAGPHDQADTMPQWWRNNYGFMFPWDDNPEVLGITFRSTRENIDGLELSP